MQELERNIKESKEEANKIDLEAQKYKNEKLNNEGLSENSQLLVTINRVEVQDVRNNFENIEVRIILDSFNKTLNYASREYRDFIFDENLTM